MASAAGYQIAREKYQARAAQAGLTYEIHKQEVLQAELQRSQHSQQALEAQISRTQHEAETQMAQEQLRYSESEFAQNKVHILLQGFNAISSIFHNIAWIASLLMGFTAVMFMKEKQDNTGVHLKYIFWAFALSAVVMLVHSIFVSTLSLTDATKLAYQGTQGMHDLKRAFHGLMKRRAEVYWNFMIGFILWNCVVVITVWVKLDTAQGTNDRLEMGQLVFGSVITFLYVVIPLARMLCSWSSIREEFKVIGDATSDTAYFREEGRTGAEITEQDLIPRSHAAALPPAGWRPGGGGGGAPGRAPYGGGLSAAAGAEIGAPATAAGHIPGADYPAAAGSRGPPADDADGDEDGGADEKWDPGPDERGDSADDDERGDEYDREYDDDDYDAAVPPSASGTSQQAPGARGGGGVRIALGAAEWTPDRHVKVCGGCKLRFGTMRRKHHCRSCGEVFCDACSCHSARLQKPGSSVSTRLRVCTQCVSVYRLRCECHVCQGARNRLAAGAGSDGGSGGGPQF